MHWKYNNYVLKLSMMDPSVCMTATHVTLNFDTFQHTLQFQLMLHALCLIYRNTNTYWLHLYSKFITDELITFNNCYTMSKTRTPGVSWAQRQKTLFLAINVRDIVNPVIKVIVLVVFSVFTSLIVSWIAGERFRTQFQWPGKFE